jgi:hypothetical protein
MSPDKKEIANVILDSSYSQNGSKGFSPSPV